jgi:hypothetical protein
MLVRDEPAEALEESDVQQDKIKKRVPKPQPNVPAKK